MRLSKEQAIAYARRFQSKHRSEPGRTAVPKPRSALVHPLPPHDPPPSIPLKRALDRHAVRLPVALRICFYVGVAMKAGWVQLKRKLLAAAFIEENEKTP